MSDAPYAEIEEKKKEALSFISELIELYKDIYKQVKESSSIEDIERAMEDMSEKVETFIEKT